MIYNYFFEISSLIATAFFLFDLLWVKRFPRVSTSALRALFILNIITSLLGTVAQLLAEPVIRSPIWLSVALNLCYNMIQVLLPIGILMYALSKCSTRPIVGRTERALMLLPLIVFYGLLIVNLWTGVLYTYDADGALYKTIVYDIAYYALTAIYMLFAILVGARYQKDKTSRHSVLICVAVIAVALTLSRVLAPTHSMTTFCYFIGLALLYIILERPTNYIDAETMQLNKNAYIAHIEQCIDKGINVTSVVVELDNFSQIGRLFGVEAVDKLRNEIIKSIMHNIPKMVTMFKVSPVRLIFTDTSPNAMLLANRIKHTIDGNWAIGGAKYPITVSLATLSYPEHYADLQSHGRVIEFCFEQIRKEGGDKILVVDDLFLSKYYRSLDVEQALMRILRNDGILVQYCPVMSILEDKVVALEAMLRVSDDKLGYITYEEAIAVAEKKGLVLQLGEQLLSRAAKFIVDYVQSGVLDIGSVCVDLSALQLIQEDFCYRILSIMKRYHADTQYLMLEMSEKVFNVPENLALSQMNRLRKEGVKFVCNGYGTGRATLSHILNLPFSVIKYDKRILRSYMNSARTGIIVDNQLYAFAGLNMSVGIDGVENKEQLDFVKGKTISYAQGYYYANSMPEKEIISFCTSYKMRREGDAR